MGPAPLQALIDAEAAAFIEEHERVESEGEPIMLNPQAYSTMALVVHELVTNSSKYGSLSGPSGKVRLAGRAMRGAISTLPGAKQVGRR